LPIVGTAIEYNVGGFVLYMDRSVAKRLLDIDGADFFLIRADQNSLTDVETALRSIADKQGLMLHSFTDLSRMLDTIMKGVVTGLWGLLVLGFIVSAFGIANTLTMNVLEQTREIALLRVVAMTRWQVRKMIVSQAAIIGVIGLLAGIIAGVNTAYIISLCTMPLLGYPIAFSLHWTLLAGSFAVAFVIVLLAAWMPAERAARLNLLIALHYE
jgi:putative ABC transport system permease protein